MIQGAEKYLRYSRRGGLKAAFLLELRPTVLVDEIRAGSWISGTNKTQADTIHPSGELRLTETEITAVSQDKHVNLEPFKRYLFNAGQALYAGSDYFNFVQTFITPQAFKLEKIQIGLLNVDYGYTGTIDVKLLTGFQVPKTNYMGRVHVTHSILTGAKVLYEARIDCSRDKVDNTNASAFRSITVDRNVWVPGGNQVCAIAVSLGSTGDDVNTGAIKLRTTGGSQYLDGRLFAITHVFPVYEDFGADMAFKLIGRGYHASGSVNYVLDLGGNPAAYSNEISLEYREPSNSAVTFTAWESSTGAFSGEETSLGQISDGAAFSKRYLKIRANMLASSDSLETPRISSIRASSTKSIKFCKAERHLFGYPNILAAPPEYSASGNPLEGDSSIDDSRLVLADPGGMVTDIFKNYDLLDDQVRVYMGFEARGFEEADFIPFRRLKIDDWEKDGAVFVIQCIDAQMRLKQAEYPVTVDPPEDTDEVHFNLMGPGSLVRELLYCAGVRSSEIEHSTFDDLDEYFTESGGPWQFNMILKSGDSIKEKIAEVMALMPGFLALGQDGKWRARWIEFDATPVATITQNMVRRQSTRHTPNLKDSSNVVKLLYGSASGGDEDDFQRAMIAGSSTSIQAQKRLTTKVLKCGILSIDRQDMAASIATRLLALTKEGLQTVTAEAQLESAILEIGDIVNVECDSYFRKGAVNPNPLLCQTTRSSISPDSKGIELTFKKLLDAEESAPGATPVAAPENFDVQDNQDGSMTWSFDASTDEPGVVRYELLQRVNRLHSDWFVKRSIEADGSPSYEIIDTEFSESMVFDFALRAVTSDGRKSMPEIVENRQVTNTALEPPEWILKPIVGGWGINITVNVEGATGYVVHRYRGATQTWEPEQDGTIAAPAYIYVGKKSKTDSFNFTAWVGKLGNDFGRFRVSSVNQWGESELSAEQKAYALPYPDGTTLLAAADIAPTLPAESGTYPILTRVQQADGAFSYYAELKVVLPADYVDLVKLVKVQRREYSGSAWLDWIDLPAKEITADPAPGSLIWRNTQAELLPGKQYQWRAGVVTIDGTVSDWSDPLGITITAATATPDKPSILSVIVITTGIQINFSPIVQGGNAVKGKHYYKVEGQKLGGSWETLSLNHEPTWFLHTRPDANQDETWRFRVTAYNNLDVASTVSDATDYYGFGKLSSNSFTEVVNGTLAQVSVNAGNISLKVDKNGVINAINISTEGIKIISSLLSISGSTEFSSGYDPTSKVAMLAGQYNSAASGARVRIFPDANTGIQVVDDSANDVFKAIVGGADVGDLILGNISGSYLKFDKSAGLLTLAVNNIIIPGIGYIDDDFIYGNWDILCGDGCYISVGSGGGFFVNGSQVVGARKTGISAMTNVTAPSNWNADTVTLAELADIVGTVINTVIRGHGLAGN